MGQKTLFQVEKKKEKKRPSGMSRPRIKQIPSHLNIQLDQKELHPSSTAVIDEDLVAFINRRQRQILVHSYLYYEKDVSLILDSVYDKWSKELASMLQEHKEESRASAYYFEFKGFDGSTGMNLPYRVPWVEEVAARLLERKGGRQGVKNN